MRAFSLFAFFITLSPLAAKAETAVNLGEIDKRIAAFQKACDNLGSNAKQLNGYLSQAVSADNEKKLASPAREASQGVNDTFRLCNEQAGKISESHENSKRIEKEIQAARAQMGKNVDALVADSESAQSTLSAETKKLAGKFRTLHASLENTRQIVGEGQDDKEAATGKIAGAFRDFTTKKKPAWEKPVNSLTKGNPATSPAYNAKSSLESYRLKIQDEAFKQLVRIYIALETTKKQVTAAAGELESQSQVTAARAKGAGEATAPDALRKNTPLAKPVASAGFSGSEGASAGSKLTPAENPGAGMDMTQFYKNYEAQKSATAAAEAEAAAKANMNKGWMESIFGGGNAPAGELCYDAMGAAVACP